MEIRRAQWLGRIRGLGCRINLCFRRGLGFRDWGHGKGVRFRASVMIQATKLASGMGYVRAQARFRDQARVRAHLSKNSIYGEID